MSRYISDSLRQSVKERAGYVCEYCLMSEEDAFINTKLITLLV